MAARIMFEYVINGRLPSAILATSTDRMKTVRFPLVAYLRKRLGQAHPI